MHEIKKEFGKRIKYYRELNNLTQEQLSELLNLNCRSLSFIERGTNFVTADTLDKLCRHLNVTPKQLFDFHYSPLEPMDYKTAINNLVDQNEDKISEIYKIIHGFVE